jgi:hypothetical protein
MASIVSSIVRSIAHGLAGESGGIVIPANAILDRSDSPILDRADAYIETR